MTKRGNLGSERMPDIAGYDSYWIPSAYMYKTTNVAQTTNLTAATPAPATLTTTAGRLNGFTMPSGGKFKSTCTDPFYATVQGQISGLSVSAVPVYQFAIYKNGALITAEADNTYVYAESTSNQIKSQSVYSQVLIEFGDEIELYITDVNNSIGWNTYSFNLGIDFKGWAQ